MKITAKSGRGTKIHISVDGEYLLTVDSDFWYSCGYISGDEIDERELTAFKKAAGSRIAFNSAMYSLDLRDHSVREMRNKLSRKYDDEAVESAIEKLCDLNLLNDERFAENFARELYERKRYGRQRIKSELYVRGIASDIINDTLDELLADEDDNVERIVDIIRRKYYNKLSDENSRRRVFAALARLGYGFSDIREAMNEFSDEDYYEDY